MATVVRQAQQETCDRNFDAAVRYHDDPSIPPGEFEEHDEKVWSDVGEVFSMSPDAVFRKRDK
jgi:hypothetical protein